MGITEDRAGQLPKYEHPPVIEVAVGVEFVPMQSLGVVELVELHHRWAEKYPKVEVQPPLPSSVQPIAENVMAGIGIRIGSGVGEIRLWMLDSTGHTLIQVQNDRLVLNWRRLGDGDPYPSYRVLRAEFGRIWAEFSEFAKDLGELRPTTVDVTFVNSVAVAGEAADLGQVLGTSQPMPVPGQVRVARTQQVAELRSRAGRPGQLIVTAEQPGNSQHEMGLTLVTRISLSGDELDFEAVMESLDFAHETGVMAFTNITTPEMHKVWGRKQ